MKSRHHLLQLISEDGGRFQRQDDIELYIPSIPVRFLLSCTQQGFLLHGSPLLLPTLEPRQPIDYSQTAERRKAVYMSDDVAHPMFSAITVGERGGYRVYKDACGRYTTLDFFVRHASNLANRGYIYVVNRADHADFVDGDFLSYRPVTPVAHVLFQRCDFPYPIRIVQP